MLSRTLAAVAAIAASCLPALAGAEGDWPPESQGAALPRPAWVLVVPARRAPDGTVKAWDRGDAWVREWVVPRPAPGGLRTVAVSGDSEDARTVEGWQLDSMDKGALGRLAAKYGAPAVAVALVSDGGEAAVAAWAPGRQAAWDHAAAPGREAALKVVADLFSGSRPSPNAVQAERPSGPSVTITGVRERDGRREFRVESDDPGAIRAISAAPGVAVVEQVYSVRPAVVVAMTDGRAIEQALLDAGLALR